MKTKYHHEEFKCIPQKSKTDISMNFKVNTCMYQLVYFFKFPGVKFQITEDAKY